MRMSIENITGIPPAQIVAEFNRQLSAEWVRLGTEAVPVVVRMPPEQLGYIMSQVLGPRSLMEYVLENNLCTIGFGVRLRLVADV